VTRFPDVILSRALLRQAQQAAKATESVSSSHTVLYVVSSEPDRRLPVSLTYINSSGGTQQENYDGSTPYEIEVRRSVGDPVYMSAQLQADLYYHVHVAILVDGTLVQEARTTAEYGVATASGIVR
jgi:hypothetical protein